MPTSFPPVVDVNTGVVILGSMPGAVSLSRRQYYAHPRNLFWRIAAELVGFDAGTDYEKRLAALRSAGIGLWDVLQSCDRTGSLDSAIAPNNMEANNFGAFFAAYPKISRVFFNGAKAEETFNRLVQPVANVAYTRLPSTSPANAAVPYAVKLQAWRAIVEPLGPAVRL